MNGPVAARVKQEGSFFGGLRLQKWIACGHHLIIASSFWRRLGVGGDSLLPAMRPALHLQGHQLADEPGKESNAQDGVVVPGMCHLA